MNVCRWREREEAQKQQRDATVRGMLTCLHSVSFCKVWGVAYNRSGTKFVSVSDDGSVLVGSQVRDTKFRFRVTGFECWVPQFGIPNSGTFPPGCVPFSCSCLCLSRTVFPESYPPPFCAFQTDFVVKNRIQNRRECRVTKKFIFAAE